MAGNKAIYDTAIKRAHDHAWANQWQRALKEYNRALAEFPDDRTALRNKAQCLLRLRLWDQALPAYQQLTQPDLGGDPNDLFAINRLAEVYLALKQIDDAAHTYHHLADLYVQNKQLHEAIRALRDLARAIPNSQERGLQLATEVHQRLLQLTEQLGDTRAQAAEHLALSRIALQQSDLHDAQHHADAAISLDPNSSDARRALHSVRRRIAEAASTAALGGDTHSATLGDSVLGTQYSVLTPEPPEALALIEQATHAQQAGDLPGALELYDQAVRAGVLQPAAFYNAGLLAYELGQPDRAIPFLQRAANDPEYATSANYIIGKSYTTNHNYPSAIPHFERAINAIDLARIGPTEADELVELYVAAADANISDHNPGRAASLYTQLVRIFKDKKWQHPQLELLEKKADELYHASIQSKLLGISRGSGLLALEETSMMGTGIVSSSEFQVPTDSLPNPQSKSAPVPTHILHDQANDGRPPTASPQQEESTHLLNQDGARQPALAEEIVPNSEYRVPSDSLLGTQHDSQGSQPAPEPAPAQSPEIVPSTEYPVPSSRYSVLGTQKDATTIMRQPGSSLRTITEYLRASDIITSGDLPEIVPNSEYRVPSTEYRVPSDSLLGTEYSVLDTQKHVLTELSHAAVLDAQHQSILVRQLLAEGEYAIGGGMWDAAIDSCMAVIGMEPDYLPVHLMLGEIYLLQSRGADAVTKYEMVLDTYVARKEPQTAATVCQRLVELQPDNIGLKTRLGSLFLEAGSLDQAASALLAVPDLYMKQGDTERALEEALNLKNRLPDSPGVALAIGTYLLNMGQLREALVELSRALQLEPANNQALVRIYIVLASLNETTQWDALQSLLERTANRQTLTRKFIEELHAALQRKPVPSIFYGLGILAERAEMPDIAADALDKGLLHMSLSDTSELDPAWPLMEALMCRARASLAVQAKNGALAAQKYARILDKVEAYSTMDTEGVTGSPVLATPRPQYDFLRPPEPTELYYGLAEAYAQQNKWEEALDALLALKKLMPEDHSVHTRIADIYFRQGKLSKALAELNDLLVHYQKSNDHEKTLEVLGHMAKLAPSNIAVRKKLSDQYVKMGMTEYGLEEMNTLAELQLKAGKLKDAMATYQRAGDLHFTLGQYDKAVGIYERIVRIAPRDVEARQQLINMCIQAGKVQQAVQGQRAMADWFINEGHTEEAIASLHQLIALQPDDVPALHMLAQQLVAMSEYGQAVRLYARLRRLEPENDQWAILESETARMEREAKEYQASVQAAAASMKSRRTSNLLNPAMAS